MFRKRFFLTIILLLNLFGYVIFSQNKTKSKEEILKLTEKATQSRWNNEYEQSLLLSRQNLADAIAIKDPELIATCYNTLAANFGELGELEKALEFYEKGYSYAKNTDNSQLKIWLSINLGEIYCSYKKDYKKGINHLKKGIEFSSKTADTSDIIILKSYIANAYFKIGQFQEGLPYLNFVNKYNNRSRYDKNWVLLETNRLNAMYSSYKNDSEKAISFFEKAIAYGKKYNKKQDLLPVYEEYSKFLFKEKDFKGAYENLAAHSKIITEVNLETRKRKVSTLGINLELDEYKRQIGDIETKNSLLLEKQENNKLIFIIIISVFVLSTIAFYFYFKTTKLKQKNRLKDIESKIQENILNASINGQEIERKKIASFLHDNISALLSSAGFHLSVYSAKNPNNSEEINKTKVILNEIHSKIRDLSHRLSPSLLTRFGLFYAVEDLCEKYSNSDINFTYHSISKPKNRYDDDYEMKMYFIINELLNNTIKHSNAKNVKLTLIETNSNLFITIKDDGKGFDSRQYHNIEGFGLNQIRSRVNYMNGEMFIKSTKDEGTLVHIIVPVVYKEN